MGFIVLIAVVPYSIPTNTFLPNVAAQAGFNTAAAYVVIALWSVFCLFVLAFINRKGWINQIKENLAHKTTPTNEDSTSSPSWLASLAIGIGASVLYWPSFLARYGPFIEDRYFINVLSRMQCGQLPYVDFEFLYGPLMIYPAHGLMNLIGFSSTSYYVYLSMLQGSFFAVLYFMFQKYIPSKRNALLAFIIFIPFVFDSLLGLNYTGWRTMLALIAIIIVAKHPLSLSKGLLAGTLTGMQLAYSYEFGIIAAITIILVYITAFISESRKSAFVASLAYITSTVTVALLFIKFLTGDDFSTYLAVTTHVFEFAQITGMGNLSFYWTVNSIALFGLLSFFLVKVGMNWLQLFKTEMSFGDRLIVASLLFTLGTMKIAIQRADIWHITLPFLLLIMVVLWSVPTKIFTFNTSSKKILVGLVLIASLTRLIGIMPTSSYFIQGVINGGLDFVLDQQTTTKHQSRVYSVQSEQAKPNADMQAMANFFVSSQYQDNPVIFYGNNWGQPIFVGVCQSGYSFYHLMYSNNLHPLIENLKLNPDTLVVMGIDSYNYLFNDVPLPYKAKTLTTVKQIASWASSIHYQQKLPEKMIKEQIWKGNLGGYLVLNYQYLQSFGDNVILQKSDRKRSN